MDIEFCDNKAIIRNIEHFNLDHIFNCGQAFRWNKSDNAYIGIVKENVMAIEEKGRDVCLYPCSPQDFQKLWFDYFDLARDYGRIKKELSQDPILKEAVNFGWGIRILNQDPWETLISFIISSNNGIARIRKIIQTICERYGKPVHFNGKTYYTFPEPGILGRLEEKDLLQCGAGYRAPYIVKTAKLIYNEFNLESLRSAGYEDARKKLLTLPGVGPKVADCILLFSLGYTQAFPVDVWIQRIMESYYFKKKVAPDHIRKFAETKLKNLAGFAQQYLFFYGREKVPTEIRACKTS